MCQFILNVFAYPLFKSNGSEKDVPDVVHCIFEKPYTINAVMEKIKMAAMPRMIFLLMC